MLSILHEPELRYPGGPGAFGPHEPYPELRGGAVSDRPNPVYAAVRRVLAQAGLDGARFGSREWNPLGELVRPGASVFVLCNFVYQRRPMESELDFAGKCTHASVLRPLVDYLLLAVGAQGRVRFGNAPLQGCRWEDVLRGTGADRVQAYYRERGLPVEAVDLRETIRERGLLGDVRRRVEREGHAVAIDLGSDSLLHGLPVAMGRRGARFRVSDYDPDRTEGCHSGGSHVYLVHRAVLESDVVVSLPKLKTHEKVGITCALKGFVGAVAQKDCLAHHRFGSPRSGGDEYAAPFSFLEPLSSLNDWLQRRGSAAPFQNALLVGDRTARRALRSLGVDGGGAWYGNDTCWRMALDLARLLHHADARGDLHDRQCRTHLALVDGIVGGEADGPLNPRGVEAGTLVFGDDVARVDRVACRLMGYPLSAIPLVLETSSPMRFPVGTAASEEESVLLNGSALPERELPPVLGRAFAPPRGWRSRLPRTA